MSFLVEFGLVGEVIVLTGDLTESLATEGSILTGEQNGEATTLRGGGALVFCWSDPCLTGLISPLRLFSASGGVSGGGKRAFSGVTKGEVQAVAVFFFLRLLGERNRNGLRSPNDLRSRSEEDARRKILATLWRCEAFEASLTSSGGFCVKASASTTSSTTLDFLSNMAILSRTLILDLGVAILPAWSHWKRN